MATKPERGGKPRRTCIGCRSVRDASELIRVARLDDATLHVGRSLPGRGAWLCQASTECFEQAARTGGFARAFRVKVSPSCIDRLRLELLPARD